ncbi:MAG: AmmeMemoRadiSam system radical SAM enzyme [Bacteroidales bacterium]
MKKGSITKREFLGRCAALTTGLACYPVTNFLGTIPGDDKYRKKAMYQEETPRGIMCRICPNECVLKEGELSKCNNRIVNKSVLYTMAYGNPCSVNVDPVEKKPLYHFLPGSRAFSIATAGCNLVCLNCQNWSISQVSPDKTRNVELPPSSVIEECIAKECRSIAYTYSEPVTFYEYALDTATEAKQRGIKNIFKSNGYINPEPLARICKVIDAANIDLKAFSDVTYLKLTGGKLQPVLESLKVFRDSGVWLEITNLMVPAWTDSLDDFKKMCSWLVTNGFSTTPLHLSRFFPLHKLDQLPPTPLELLRKAAVVAESEGIKYVYLGNIPGNERSSTVCPGCRKEVVKRSGFTVISNSIVNGKCGSCNTAIPGIWN